jgi:hypothetical protein
MAGGIHSTYNQRCMPYHPLTIRNATPFTFIIAFSLLFGDCSIAQSIFTSTLNTTGGSKQLSTTNTPYPNYFFEWSVGESSIITTNSTSNWIVTHGLLQGFLLSEPIVPGALNWFPDEIVIFPNPTENDFTVELLTSMKGTIFFTLYNIQGTPLLQRSIPYQVAGSTQHFPIRHLAGGTYFLRISGKSLPENGGQIIKQGTFKIIKVQ